jgi:hypothetical protein
MTFDEERRSWRSLPEASILLTMQLVKVELSAIEHEVKIFPSRSTPLACASLWERSVVSASFTVEKGS